MTPIFQQNRNYEKLVVPLKLLLDVRAAQGG